MATVFKTAAELTRSILSKILARTKITDTTQSAVVVYLSRSFGEMLAAAYFRIAQVRNAFEPDNPFISDADLVERGNEMQVQWAQSVPASGSVLMVVRDDSSAEQTLDSGAIATGINGLQYQVSAPVVFGVGVKTVTGVSVTCMTPGAQGNCPAGSINQLASFPTWVSAVNNTEPLTSGADQESRSSYQKRLVLYKQSAARSQGAAMEFLARSYSATDGSRVRFAIGIQPTESCGYGSLLVDDGFAFPTLRRAGAGVGSITVPPGGQTIVNHEGPATAPFDVVYVARAAGGTSVLKRADGDFESLHERGIIKVPAGKSWSLLAGDVVTLPPYQVFTGIIAELQRQVEGSFYDPQTTPGWRAKGCRVAVAPPERLLVDYLVSVVPQNGVSLLVAQDATRTAILAFHQAIPPGEPVFMSQVIAAIMANNDIILTVALYEPGTLPLEPKQDAYCNDRQSLRTLTNLITFVAN